MDEVEGNFPTVGGLEPEEGQIADLAWACLWFTSVYSKDGSSLTYCGYSVCTLNICCHRYQLDIYKQALGLPSISVGNENEASI